MHRWKPSFSLLNSLHATPLSSLNRGQCKQRDAISVGKQFIEVKNEGIMRLTLRLITQLSYNEQDSGVPFSYSLKKAVHITAVFFQRLEFASFICRLLLLSSYDLFRLRTLGVSFIPFTLISQILFLLQMTTLIKRYLRCTGLLTGRQSIHTLRTKSSTNNGVGQHVSANL